MKNFALLLLFLTFSLSVSAQVYIQNTMYRYTPVLYNPAAAGMTQGEDQGLKLAFLGRLQWVGIDGAPRTSAITADAGVGNNMGLGAYLIGDQLGPISTTGLNVAYSYQFEFGLGNKLSIGVNGGILQKAINGDFVTPDGVPDPLVGMGFYSATSFIPNLGAGIYFSGLNDRLTIGLSGQDLLEPSVEGLFLQDVGTTTTVPRSFYVMAGYKIPITQSADGSEDIFSITPMVFARTEGTFPPQFDVSVFADYKVLTGGLSYRGFNDSFSAILGFDVNDRMFLGYSFDYTLSPLNASQDLSSHEIILTYSLRGGLGRSGASDGVKKDNDTGGGILLP